MNLQISPLLSSSSGNTSLLSTESTTLLVDAGAAGSLIEKAIREVGFSPASLGGILITHEHLDHIKGAGVLSPQIRPSYLCQCGHLGTDAAKDRRGRPAQYPHHRQQ